MDTKIIKDIDEFYSALNKEDGFENTIINLEGKDLIIEKFNTGFISYKLLGSLCYNDSISQNDPDRAIYNQAGFSNCIFNCKSIEFRNIIYEKLNLSFSSCTFNCTVRIDKCVFNEIVFRQTKQINVLDMNGGNRIDPVRYELNKFWFDDIEKRDDGLEANLRFANMRVKDLFAFQDIKHIKGHISFVNNVFGNNDMIKDSLIFRNSIVTNVCFIENTFFGKSAFYKNIFTLESAPNSKIGATKFIKNIFNNVGFSEANFIGKCEFQECNFLSNADFASCNNLNDSEINFVACEFKGLFNIKKSFINSFIIDRCVFEKASSFTDTIFNQINFSDVNFLGKAFFDDIRINNVLNKSYLKDKVRIKEWKRTLRTIKQELQKTENKIEFNKYRNYELSAHYGELNFCENPTDTIILWATKWSSNFGNWIWALFYTLISGLFFYGILYKLENSGSYNSDKWDDFFVGAFRFFLITDFHNPLGDGKFYLVNVFSWVFFILGKIFIAFGIYEIIQSFRKFKV